MRKKQSWHLTQSGRAAIKAAQDTSGNIGQVASGGEKPGNEPEEAKLQNTSKQIVQTAILQAVKQVSQESQQKELKEECTVSQHLKEEELIKKHDKKK
ncbi:A-kinase anchor protein inhibitor 1 [Rhinatrema bivittatum]|uniref:A-kinase anchor protein inhibitor 1 n=1 Tax=Rhinatrema bivittatum TaxID=194408 RepID=UPI00112A0298|nr:A-kinase anchor protein inhibitor 1 [Rhinatrema bivittatum]